MVKCYGTFIRKNAMQQFENTYSFIIKKKYILTYNTHKIMRSIHIKDMLSSGVSLK